MGIFETLSFTFPELALAIGAMALLIAGVFLGDKSAKQVSYACVALLIAAGALVIFGPSGSQPSLFDGAFRIDAFSDFCKVIIFGAAALAILMSDRYLAGEKLGRFEYPVLIVLAAFGMSLMVSATDLISLYMGVETQSLALYILAAFNRDSRRSTEAGLKYFVLGALSSGLLLYGASLVYGFTGSTSFDDIANAAAAGDGNVGLIIGLVFLISGLAFKVSAAPFHMWTPDVYEGSPTPVTAFFAAAPKLAAMALFTRVLTTSFSGVLTDWQPVIAMIAVASMTVGAFSAIPQTNVKRLMAYSSIGHMGYALIGLAAGSSEGVRAVLIYMTVYVLMTLGAFAVILMMRRRGGMTENISDLAGLSRTNMPMALILTVLLFSLAGVPPTAGFFGKWFVFFAAVDAGLIWLAVVGVIASAISAFYYLRIVWFMWFDEPAPAFERDSGPALTFAAWGSALLMFPLLTVFMGPLTQAAGRAAASLF
ncbi:MAG: NADH-quinone oxidoreductase subunit NuoN [Pseudomonadota bacterium]